MSWCDMRLRQLKRILDDYPDNLEVTLEVSVAVDFNQSAPLRQVRQDCDGILTLSCEPESGEVGCDG